MVEADRTFEFVERFSDSPLVERIWYTQSNRTGAFISAAATHCEMVMMRYQGQLTVTLRGPETKATIAPFPANAEFWGIRFNIGTFMPALPNSTLVDEPVNLPIATKQSFWLHGAPWELPTYENADTFVARLVQEELLVQDPVVDAVLENRPLDLSRRSIQRRFLRATGLTHGALSQIERAQQARSLLINGVSILDVVERAGYADQPHLTRSLKRFTGQTPAQILRTSDA